jgi:hypothetical protein
VRSERNLVTEGRQILAVTITDRFDPSQERENRPKVVTTWCRLTTCPAWSLPVRGPTSALPQAREREHIKGNHFPDVGSLLPGLSLKCF